MRVWSTLLRFIDERGAAALVTVVETQGSSPREAGARMLVRPDGGFTGTIGGGTLEWRALQDAQAALARGGDRLLLRSHALGPELGQCCGGRVLLGIETATAARREEVATLARREEEGALVTLLRLRADGVPERRILEEGEPAGPGAERLPDGAILERFVSDDTPVWILGAGHVGRALVLALAPLPFRVTWIDPRPDAFPAHVPANVTARVEPDPGAALDAAPPGAFLAVMTHSHALDLDVVARALAAGRFPYVGLIGSETKRARFEKRLYEIGLGGRLGRLVCPIGIRGIDSKLPAAIAASVAAELLTLRGRMAGGAERPREREVLGG